ncbi:hypothetical protein ABT176_004009 [Escherichia coli]|uniref:hypothetical protein n=1 Tax=Escherichia coli TaxID=562 RepID=UPI0014330831|nr:hypothetical protein [Escherichia coli]EFH8684281.1 hypothetical protein [Escherichia coli]MDC3642843.1 hypothetical protein [Escherichia coli]NKA37865.1 hypothetical protein [Escherichia coli]USX42497.1 hypothetical protein NH569_05185 [Escherichia coli]HDN3347038.1 hypothetical protein [Escherichia coli]
MDLNISTLTNKVVFKVDFASLQKARDAGKKFQKEMENLTNPTLKGKKAKRAIDDANDLVKARKAAQAKTDAKASDKQAQTDKKNADKVAKAEAKAKAKAAIAADKQIRAKATIAEKAEIKRQQAFRQLEGIKKGRMGDGMDSAQYYKTLQYIKQQTAAYEKGAISQAKMNHLIRDRITLERRAAAVKARQVAADGGKYPHMAKQLKGGHIGGGVGAMVGGAALTAATLGGAAIFNTVTDQASKITDTNRKAKAVNVNTNALLALNQYGLEHGVDSSVDQRQDNLKDVQERLGESVGNTKWDAKKGRWAGGNGAVDNILNKYGWSPEQVKGFQTDPLGFLGAVVKEGERRGLSDQEIGHILEDLGNDLQYFRGAFSRNGEELNKTLVKMQQANATYTQADLDAAERLQAVQANMNMAWEGSKKAIMTGFGEEFDAQAGEEWAQMLKDLNPLFKELGSSTAEMMSAFAGAVSWLTAAYKNINPENKHENLDSSGMYYKDSFVGGMVDWGRSALGLSPIPGTEDKPTAGGTAIQNYASPSDNVQSLKENVSRDLNTTPSMTYAPNIVVNVPESKVDVNIAPDGSQLGSYLDYKVGSIQQDFERSFTLAALSGQAPS